MNSAMPVQARTEHNSLRSLKSSRNPFSVCVPAVANAAFRSMQVRDSTCTRKQVEEMRDSTMISDFKNCGQPRSSMSSRFDSYQTFQFLEDLGWSLHCR